MHIVVSLMLFASTVLAATGRSEMIALAGAAGPRSNKSARPWVTERRLKFILGSIRSLNPTFDNSVSVVNDAIDLYPADHIPEVLPAAMRDLEFTQGAGLPKSVYLLTIIAAELPSPLQIKKYVSDLRGPIDSGSRLILAVSTIPVLTDVQWGEYAESLRRDVGLGDGAVTVIHPVRLHLLAGLMSPNPTFVTKLFDKFIFTRRIASAKYDFDFARQIEVMSGSAPLVSSLPHVESDRLLFECRSDLTQP